MNTKYVVNFSTGLSSFESLRRTIEKFGKKNVIAAFCDVRGDYARDPHAAPSGTNWDGEDDDNYRFLEDVEKLLNIEVVRIRHPQGLGVWGAIFQAKAITIRGQALTFAPCTKRLKMDTMDAFVENLSQKHKVIQVLGLGWMEDDRVVKARRRLGSDVYFPMTDEPHIQNCDIIKYLRDRGIEPPRSYEMGYPHSNCGGACIKAGQKQWAELLRHNPERYGYNEDQEDWFRDVINPHVAILRDARGGTVKALPLNQFRMEVLYGDRDPEPFSWGGCGCFAPSEQMKQEGEVIEGVRL
jgi:hypothetical protein